MQRLLEPLAERIHEQRPERAVLARKALGAQIGAILGYVSRRVLGQFDVFLPPDDDGLIYFVGPNLIEAERRFALPPADFRLWIAIHEVTHRVQFDAAPWLHGHLAGLVEEYLSTVSLDAAELRAQLRRARGRSAGRVRTCSRRAVSCCCSRPSSGRSSTGRRR